MDNENNNEETHYAYRAMLAAAPVMVSCYLYDNNFFKYVTDIIGITKSEEGNVHLPIIPDVDDTGKND